MNTTTLEMPSIAQSVTDWQISHQRRRSLGVCCASRPFLGLAALVGNFDQEALTDGTEVFLANRAIRWMALRDLPRGQVASSPTLFRRGATYVQITRAGLRYAMPRIDFASSPTRDLKLSPVPAHFARSARPDTFVLPQDLREFAAAIRLSDRLTDATLQHPHRWLRGRESLLAIGRRPFPVPYFEFTQFQQHGSRWSPVFRDAIVVGQKVLVPAWLADHLKLQRSCRRLWWQVTALEPFLDCALDAFLLPPIPLAHWTISRGNAFGTVDVCVPARSRTSSAPPPSKSNPQFTHPVVHHKSIVANHRSVWAA